MEKSPKEIAQVVADVIAEGLTSYEERADKAERRVRELEADKERLDWLLSYALEIVAKVPGGIYCIDSRDDIDAARRGEG